jgi:hypothetical protein
LIADDTLFFSDNMDAIKIDIDVDSRLPSTTTISSELMHMEQDSEEEMHIPFTFVDVNVSQELFVLFTY